MSAIERIKTLLGKDKPKTLYISRPVLNAEAIVEWALKVGFKTTLPPEDMHVTVAFSKTPVRWSTLQRDTVDIKIPYSKRQVTRLGENATVLKFESAYLYFRWRTLCEGGCSWDWPTYQPHITISHQANIEYEVIPYDGLIHLGPESPFKELDLNWQNKIKEQ